MNGGLTSFEIRLLICASCGAPIETIPRGGHAQCTYCRAVMEVSPRKDRPEDFRAPAPFAPQSDDAARFARLREQVGSTDAYSFPPAGLRNLAFRVTNPTLRPEVEKRWREALDEALQRPSDTTDARLYWCTVLVRSTAIQAKEFARARAVVEMAADVVRDPVFRTLLRISLGARACDAGDVVAAEAWLAAIDPKPGLLAVHTDLALVRARIALLKKTPRAVFDYLGQSPADVPIAPTDDALACMLRATAYEEMNDISSARSALRAVCRHFGGKVFGPKKVALFRNAYPNQPLCVRTYPSFRRGVLVRRAVAGALVSFAVAVPALLWIWGGS
jgi:DNA-directed RNA polymerase subunit RPC12/RpoP